jgi:hypothetical protein
MFKLRTSDFRLYNPKMKEEEFCPETVIPGWFKNDHDKGFGFKAATKHLMHRKVGAPVHACAAFVDDIENYARHVVKSEAKTRHFSQPRLGGI